MSLLAHCKARSDWLLLPLAALHINCHRVNSKIRLTMPREKMSRVDRNPWLAKMVTILHRDHRILQFLNNVHVLINKTKILLPRALEILSNIQPPISIDLPVLSCELDPMPTYLLKQCVNNVLPVITTMVNKSLNEMSVPTAFKKAIVRSLLKKPVLDMNNLKN